MKKLFSVMLASILIFTLVACQGDKENSSSLPESEKVSSEVCFHKYETEVIEKSTATTKGKAKNTCSLCGKIYDLELPTEIKILAVGNSFSEDGMAYLWNVLTDAGVGKVTLGNLYIAGCSLDMHWENVKSGEEAYTYRKNTSGQWVSNPSSLKTALLDEEWDVITLQQVSDKSGQPGTFANLHNLASYLDENKTNKDAKLFWHMTWAYDANSTHSGFKNYGNDQSKMYEAILFTTKTTALGETLFTGCIPSGTTIQNLRTTSVSGKLTRDGYHLSKDFGRYAAALTWMTAITGISPEKVDWVPSEYKSLSNYDNIIDRAVISAIETPDAVTKIN